MKHHRLKQMLNFFAFNLLFFAIFLNFIHKDKNEVEAFLQKNSTALTSSFKQKVDSKDQDTNPANIEVVVTDTH